MSPGERKDREPDEQLRRLEQLLADREAEVRTAQQALAHSRQWLAFALDAAQLVAWEWDTATEHIERYGDTEAVWGIPAWYLIDHPHGFLDCVHPEDRDAVLASMRHGDGGGCELEFRVISPIDGSQRWILDRHRCVLNPDGKPGRIYGISIDVTLRKLWEQQLQQVNALLEETAAERAALAHERLAQVRQLALELSDAEQSERRRLAQVLHDHMQQLLVAAKIRVEHLQRRSTVEADRQHLQQVRTFLEQCVESARSLAVELNPPVLTDAGLTAALRWLGQWMLDHHDFTVQIEADPAHDPASPTVAAFVFHSVRELLLNVVKHSGVSEAHVRLTPSEGDELVVVVADHGRGFPAEALEARRGGGFGLFSIRERVNLLGGSFELVSAPGGGTRVRITVPRAREYASALKGPTKLAIVPPLSSSAEAQDAHRRALKVLLVDDHAMVRDGLAELIRREPDMQVVGAAAEGQAAIELCDLLEPDVIVMDVNMPVMNGMEATRHIAHRHPAARIIAISLHDDPQIVQHMRDAGAAGYVCKTADPMLLIQTIRAAAGG